MIERVIEQNPNSGEVGGVAAQTCNSGAERVVADRSVRTKGVSADGELLRVNSETIGRSPDRNLDSGYANGVRQKYFQLAVVQRCIHDF